MLNEAIVVTVQKLSKRQQQPPQQPPSSVSTLVKPALQLRGLTFGNKIDKLLRGGLMPKTLTFLYGVNANSMMNALCARAVSIYGGKSIFIDAANSFDPYLIVQRNNSHKSEKSAKEFIESIIVSRAFTCYQLRKLVTSKIANMMAEEENQIKSIFVSGVSSLFSEQDNTIAEIARIEFLIAQSLQRIATDKKNGVLFVVASSNTSSMSFIMKSDTAIKIFNDHDGGDDTRKAVLMKHYARNFETVRI